MARGTGNALTARHLLQRELLRNSVKVFGKVEVQNRKTIISEMSSN
jgi:hypothetical protein